MLPFLIDWDRVIPDGLHPAATSPSGCTLTQLHMEHPDPAFVEAAFARVGMEVACAGRSAVARAAVPKLQAVLETPKGPVLLHDVVFDGVTSKL
eukprot:COSAG01_NODE_33786_length_558_cov_2.291939_1_plen_94_part_00